jgi:hypothetical protein
MTIVDVLLASVALACAFGCVFILFESTPAEPIE